MGDICVKYFFKLGPKVQMLFFKKKTLGKMEDEENRS